MILYVAPVDALQGTVLLPASKSYSIRAFMIAACGGTSKIKNPSHCNDAKVAMQVARQLGAIIKYVGSGTWQVMANQRPPRLAQVNVHESGTVLRFLLPLVALHGQKAIIDGRGTLKGRPNQFLTQTLRMMGVCIRGHGKEEGIPIHLSGGMLQGGEIQIDGSLSSQFISALLIACPQLKEATSLTIRGSKAVSNDYIAMTLKVLAQSGIVIKRRGSRHYTMQGTQTFKGLSNFVVPSDYGLAAFLMAAALLHPSHVVLHGNFPKDLIQADHHILPLLKKMGARLRCSMQSIAIDGPALLRGGQFSLKDCPDLVPIMAVLALFAKGKSRLCEIGHARSKESDRISDLACELRKIGARIEEAKDAMVIYPQAQYVPDCLLDPHQDHRLAMAFAVLGTKLGARIKDIDCTAKSYPGFVRDFQSLGAKVAHVK